MFDSLSDKLQAAFKNLRGMGKLSEKNMRDGLRDVRMSLLEADVNFKVVKQFVADVEQKALGQAVLDSIYPAQQIVKIVHEELIELMGTENVPLQFASKPPTVIMLVGLQGSGKTTTAGKLAKVVFKKGHRPLLVGADIYRPAAITQLQVLAEGVGFEFFSIPDSKDAVAICKRSIAEADKRSLDVVILDTAGRLHIDEALMGELAAIEKAVSPTEILLVADAMTGQDAVNAAKSFKERLNLTGAILTKLDGDARGGAALSIRAVTNCPIKFVGVGEKLDALEPFHPERMASRILGMGDVVSLVEKAQAAFDEKQAQKWEEHLRKKQLTLEDFLEQLKQVRSMGSLGDVLAMIPGLGNKLKGIDVDDSELDRVEAIINSMTKIERKTPKIIDGSRRRRIAAGSGTTVHDVNQVLKQFDQLNSMMRKMKKGKGMPFGLGKGFPLQ